MLFVCEKPVNDPALGPGRAEATVARAHPEPSAIFLCASLLLFLSIAARAEIPSTNAPAAAGAAAWHFRVGPFFEIGQSREGLDVLAVRPFYSRVAGTNAHESLTDVVWPWSSFHRRDDYSDWWAFPAFDKDENVRDPLSRHTFWLLPIYCEGRTRSGEDFAAVFPINGSIRDFIWLDELHFTLFPLYLDFPD